MSNLQEKAKKFSEKHSNGKHFRDLEFGYENGFSDCQKEYEEKLSKFHETIMQIIGHGDPYPLEDVLKDLKWATEYLLVKKSYDGHKYEELEQSVRRANQIIAILETREGHFL